MVGSMLADDPSIKAVLVTHNETSTRVTNDIGAIAKVVRGHDRLMLVDAISSVGCVPWRRTPGDLDVVVTGSQKGFMVPRGWPSRQWAQGRGRPPRQRRCRASTSTLRSTSATSSGDRPRGRQRSPSCSPWTLPSKSCSRTGWRRSTRSTQRSRRTYGAGVKELGLELFVADEAYASNTVTAVKVPEGVELSKLRGLLRTDRNVVVAAGRARWTARSSASATWGTSRKRTWPDVMESLAAVLPQTGFPVTASAG